MAKRFTHSKLIFMKTFPVFAILSAAVLVFSCNQDSIFAGISAEQEPKDPRISGTPANIVVAGKALYAASSGSGTVHKYTGSWTTFSAPGAVRSLASDDDASNPALYALAGDPMSASLYRYDTAGSKWDSIDAGEASGYYSLQSIYGAGGEIFAGGKNKSGSDYGIFYIDGTATPPALKKLRDKTSLLSGAAVDNNNHFFFSTQGSGIYKFDTLTPDLEKPPVSGSEGTVTGIMNLKGKTEGEIVAVTSGGSVLVYDDDGTSKFTDKGIKGPAFTGGMSVWRAWDSGASDWKPKLLLLGVQTNVSNSKGYREIALDDNGKIKGDSVSGPGSVSPSSVGTSNKNEYEASLARYSVRYILQVPDEVETYPTDSSTAAAYQPVVFAATARNGLQSLRDGLWNAEE